MKLPVWVSPVVLFIVVTLTLPAYGFMGGKFKDEVEKENGAVKLTREVMNGGYDVVTASELKGWIDAKKDMVIVDTMPYEASYKKAHVPGAVQILFPIPEMSAWDTKETDSKTQEDYAALLGADKDKTIVVYCGFVKCTRSHNGALWAKKMGYKNVYRFAGGIYAWKGMDYPIGKNKTHTLIVFLRAPEPGRVKTRLARDVGDDKALALYKTFAAATLAAADEWAGFSLSRGLLLSYYPENQLSMIQSWLGRNRICQPQSGVNLGQRMANAMTAAFEAGAAQVVLVGTDIPKIRAHHLEKAFELLQTNDVVLGPSLDGGYWLIGMNRKRYVPEVFYNINWGTSSVFSATIERCAQNKLTWAGLEALQDVDTLADLESIEANGFKLWNP